MADDADAICAIHNEGIEDRIATLDTELRTTEIVGWGSLNRFNPRAAYDHVADFSVYVARHRRGQGFGRRILEQLIVRARTNGFHKLVLATLGNNRPGIALYTRTGFTHVGVYREQGQLDGR